MQIRLDDRNSITRSRACIIKLFKGDTERLAKFKIRIEDPPKRKNMVFIGGAVLAEVMKVPGEISNILELFVDGLEFWL